MLGTHSLTDSFDTLQSYLVTSFNFFFPLASNRFYQLQNNTLFLSFLNKIIFTATLSHISTNYTVPSGTIHGFQFGKSLFIVL